MTRDVTIPHLGICLHRVDVTPPSLKISAITHLPAVEVILLRVAHFEGWCHTHTSMRCTTAMFDMQDFRIFTVCNFRLLLVPRIGHTIRVNLPTWSEWLPIVGGSFYEYLGPLLLINYGCKEMTHSTL